MLCPSRGRAALQRRALQREAAAGKASSLQAQTVQITNSLSAVCRSSSSGLDAPTRYQTPTLPSCRDHLPLGASVEKSLTSIEVQSNFRPCTVSYVCSLKHRTLLHGGFPASRGSGGPEK